MSKITVILDAIATWRNARRAAMAEPNPETFKRLGEAEYALMQLDLLEVPEGMPPYTPRFQEDQT